MYQISRIATHVRLDTDYQRGRCENGKYNVGSQHSLDDIGYLYALDIGVSSKVCRNDLDEIMPRDVTASIETIISNHK